MNPLPPFIPSLGGPSSEYVPDFVPKSVFALLIRHPFVTGIIKHGVPAGNREACFLTAQKLSPESLVSFVLYLYQPPSSLAAALMWLLRNNLLSTDSVDVHFIGNNLKFSHRPHVIFSHRVIIRTEYIAMSRLQCFISYFQAEC
jgi:hypothetical protein